MSEVKLTRATVEMCPECGAEVRFKEHPYKPPGQGHFWCASCELWMDKTDYGHYPIDVAAVVALMRSLVAISRKRGGTNTIFSSVVEDWADRLEGLHE